MSDSRVPQQTRRFVAERARFLCEYCRTPADWGPDPFSVEQIVSRFEDGSDTSDNLAYSCQGCNGHKGKVTTAPDPETELLTLLFNPRKERWNDHFRWSKDYTKVVPITAIGRATLARLQLNRTGLVNHRRALVAFGIHPPQF